LFKEFFIEFDNMKDELQVRSYSVGITTLEEVFLKIGHGEEEENEKANLLTNRYQSTPEKENLLVNG